MRIFLVCCVFFMMIINFACSSQKINSSKKNEQFSFSTIKNERISGYLHRYDSFSSNFITARTVDVWLPKSYSPSRKYAVLYMNDGQDLFDSLVDKRKPEMEVDETITRLVSEGKIKNTIVVGIYNIASDRSEDYLPQKPIDKLPTTIRDSMLKIVRTFDKTFEINSDNYLKFLTEEVKPYIDSHYATASDLSNTYIAGTSMGGLISMYAVCEYPEIFGGAIGMSTHWVGAIPRPGNPLPEQFFNYMSAYVPPPKEHKFYFDFGTNGLDSFYVQYEDDVNKVFLEKGYDSPILFRNIKFQNGNHNIESWKPRFPEALKMMLAK